MNIGAGIMEKVKKTETELFDDDPFRVDVPCNEENCPFMKEE